MLRVRSIESEIKVTHEEIKVRDGVRFNHVSFAKEAYFLQNALRHQKSLIDSVLTRLKMAIDKTKRGVVQSKLDHNSAFPSISD